MTSHILNSILHPRREKSRKKEKKAEKARQARRHDSLNNHASGGDQHGKEPHHPSQHPDAEREREEARKRKEDNRDRQRQEVESRRKELEEAVRKDPAGVRYGLLEHSGKPRTEGSFSLSPLYLASVCLSKADVGSFGVRLLAAEEEGGRREDLSKVDFASRIGDTIVLKARVHRVRQQGNKLAFIVSPSLLRSACGGERSGFG
jgi:hypothetical protein